MARAWVHMRSAVSPRAWKSLYHRVGSNPSTMRSCGERSTCRDGVARLVSAKMVPAYTTCRKPKSERLRSDRRVYKLFSIFSPSEIPQGYQPAIIGSTVELGEWDKTRALALTPLKIPTCSSTRVLPAPESSERVEFSWALIGDDGANMVAEVEKESDTERSSKFVDIEPDLCGLPKEFDSCLLCPGWGWSGGNLGRFAAPPDGDPIVPTAELKSTGLREPGGSTIVRFGSSACAGFESQAPWYNLTGICSGWVPSPSTMTMATRS